MKRITAFLCVCAMLLSLFPLFAYADTAGVTFTASNMLRTKDVIQTPMTIEARVKVSASAAASRLGTIVGNYKDTGVPSIGVEIKEPDLQLQYDR